MYPGFESSTFSQVKIGELFGFVFDSSNKWVYKKIGENLVECIKTPKTYSRVIGQIDKFDDPNCAVIVHLECGELKTGN